MDGGAPYLGNGVIMSEALWVKVEEHCSGSKAKTYVLESSAVGSE